MQNETSGQDLIQAFLAALSKRHLDQCAAVLAQLQAFAREQPAFAPWCDYLGGILVSERDYDWAEAERIFGRLLLTDLEPALRGRVLMALGNIHKYQGRWEEAVQVFERSVSHFTQLGQLVDQAKAWKQMAISYRRGFTRGAFGSQALQRAIECCQCALAALEPVPAPSPDVVWLTGSLWNTLGLAHRSLGQWDEAIACYQRDLAICKALDDRFGMGLSLGNLGEVYQKRGPDSWPQALEAYQQALGIIREFDDRYQEIEALANLGFFHQEMGRSDAALDYYSQAIELIEALRAGVSAEAARAGFFGTVVDTYANAVLLCLETGRHEQAFNYVEQARSRAFLDTLTAHSPQLSREIAVTPMTLAEVQAALPADALLLEYFTTGLVEARDDGTSPPPAAQRHRFPPSRTLLFAVTRDGIQVYDADLSPNDLLPRQLESIVERHFLKPSIQRALYGRLIAPVEGRLADRRRLYLIPHGPLHYIPFQALVSPTGKTLLREDGPPLVYAPSATLLLRRERQSEPAPLPCLALGYNGRSEQPLRFAEEEAFGIAQLTGGQAWVGSAPKKAALYSQARNYRLLHFSCHGEFDPESPLASALYLAPGEALTALEVMEHLRLRCELVTLSTCESGLSRVRRGDELVGLIRAFMYAGAPVLLSTLWRVDERSTLILMERFYQLVRAGTNPAEALKQAQLYLKNLTRKEVLGILVRLFTDKILRSATPSSENRAGLSAPFNPPRQAGAYLKGTTTKTPRHQESQRRNENFVSLSLCGKEKVTSRCAQDDPEIATDGADNDKVFADAYYWAPFILVGDRTAGTSDGGWPGQG